MEKQAKVFSWVLIDVLAVLLLGMVIQKAVTSTFTHDESFTYNRFVTAPLADIFSYKVASPNNHLLNTLLMKFLSWVFGSPVIILRLPNLLALAGFLGFTLLLLRKLEPWVMLPVFALATCNPYLLDFFALARGNGLSYCFLVTSIFFLVRYTSRPGYGNYLWSVLFACLGVLSHFTMLNYLLALVATVNLWHLLECRVNGELYSTKTRVLARINLINLVVFVVLGLILAGPVRKLVVADQFFYGGESGFWHDTVGSLAETFFYGAGYAHWGKILIQILVVAVMVPAAVILAVMFLKKSKALLHEDRILLLVFLLLMLTVLINVSQFYLLGTKLLIRRYGLLFVPMFMLCLGFLVAKLYREMNAKFIPLTLAMLLAIAAVVHTFAVFSSTTFLDWNYDKESGHVLALLGKEVRLHEHPGPVTLAISWPFEPTLNFYRETGGMTWLKPVTRDGPSIAAGYYYVFREDITLIPLRGGLPVILFDDGKTVLVKVIRK